MATDVAATTMTTLEPPPSAQRPPSPPPPPLQRSSSGTAAASAAAGPRVSLLRSSSYRQPRGGGAAAPSTVTDLQFTGGTMGLLRRIGRRMVVYPTGRSRCASLGASAATPSAAFSGSQPHLHKHHSYSQQDGQDSGGSSSGSADDTSSGDAAAGSGGPGLRPYRSFPAAALAAAAEAYLSALYQYSSSYSTARRHPRDPPPPSPAHESHTLLEAAPSPSQPPPPLPAAAEDPSVGRRSARNRDVDPDVLIRGSLPGFSVDKGTAGRSGLRQAGAGSPPQGPATPTAADAVLAAEDARDADAANDDAGGSDVKLNAMAVRNAAARPLPGQPIDGAAISARGGAVVDTAASSMAVMSAAKTASIEPATATTESEDAEIASCYGTRSVSSASCFSSVGSISSGGSSSESCYSCESSAGGFSCGVECSSEYDGRHGSSNDLRPLRDDDVDVDVGGYSCEVVGTKTVTLTTDNSITNLSSISDSSSVDSVSDSSSRPKLVVLSPREPTTPRPPPYTRYYPDGRGPSYKMSTPYRLLAQLTLGAYVGWPYMLLALAVAATYGSMKAAVVLAVLVGTLLLPAPPMQWEALLTSSLFRLWRAYFNFSVLYEEMLDLTVPHIYVMSPHGVFPLSQILGGTLGGLLWPGHPTFCLAASCIFYVPIWRHFKAWMGAAPANRDTAMRLLMTQGSIAVLPGGIAEMFTQAEVGFANRERIKMLGRRGFARLAVETGAPIVPVYHFGNSQLLTFGPAAFQPLSRRLRVAIGTVLGVCGLPIPHPQPLFMCIGRPISVPYTDPRDPCFEQRVEEVAEQVLDAYRRMYKRYGGEYGWSDRPLEVC